MIGLSAGVVFVTTGSIVAAIAVHALYNAASVALTWAVGADIATVVTVGPDQHVPVVAGTATVIALWMWLLTAGHRRWSNDQSRSASTR